MSSPRRLAAIASAASGRPPGGAGPEASALPPCGLAFTSSIDRGWRRAMHSSRSQPRSARRSNPRGSSCRRTCSLLRRWPTPLLPGDAPHSTPALHFPWLCIEPLFHMWGHNACRDRLTANEVKYSDRADDPGYVALISHPFFERVARQLLRSSSVHLAEMSVNSRPPSGRPQADAAWQRDER